MARYRIDTIPAPIDFQATDPVRRTLQNAKNLLMTRMGEIPYDRFRGLDPRIFDLPAALMQERLMQEVDRVLMWEPDAEAVEAGFEMVGYGEVVIWVIIEVKE